MSDTQAIRELMSAVIDGEANAAETEQVLTAVSGDGELRALWTRLHASRQQLALPGSPVVIGDTLERRFAAALAAEPAHAGEPQAAPARLSAPAAPATGSRPWWQWGGAVAVAGAVAVTVVLGSGSLSGADSQTPATLAQSNPAPLESRGGVVQGLPAVPNQAVASQGVRQVPADTSSEIERETRALMLMHVQHAAVSSRTRMVPVAKLAAFASTPR